MKTDKQRLDILLVEKGYFPSREKAKSSIMAGVVFINNNRADKPGAIFDINSEIFIKTNPNPFVSRGGLKLQKAIIDFNINLENFVCMDIGASTGGFTDCMLKSGASKVYAVDVGYGQLAWELRNDLRVVCMERTNIRFVKREDIDDILDFASIDVAFISLRLVLPVVKQLLKKDSHVVCLIKPQFEAGREKVGKKGVVREQSTHIEVISGIIEFSKQIGFNPIMLDYSPIKGPQGNIEYLLNIINSDNFENSINTECIKELVCKAHEQLK
jgi:23S rRNA (cytidine1920-2'-O)/16S rRNA (cytidine1409-2'-O)-methyltransferase